MSVKIETRSVQIRAAGDEFALVGRALSYNAISSNELYPGVRERILPGAFKESLASSRDIPALLNHDSRALPLGKLSSGTLKISDSAEGLDIRVQLDKSIQTHNDVYASVKRGDISEMSFAFVCLADNISNATYEGQTCQVRDVIKAELHDISVVTTPFYGAGATSVAARAAASQTKTPQERLAELDADHERQQRAHKITLELIADKAKAQRSAADSQAEDEPLSDEELDGLRSAIAAHFGKAQHGLTPKYFMAGADRQTAACYDMDSAALDCYSIRYDSDDDGYVFGNPEPSDDDPDEDSRSAARSLQSQTQLRFRMEALAGRRQTCR